MIDSQSVKTTESGGPSMETGDDLDERTRVKAAVLSSAIGSVGHLFVRDIDNDTLKAELEHLTRRLILLPG